MSNTGRVVGGSVLSTEYWNHQLPRVGFAVKIMLNLLKLLVMNLCTSDLSLN